MRKSKLIRKWGENVCLRPPVAEEGFRDVKMHHTCLFSTLHIHSPASYWRKGGEKKIAWQLTCTQTTAITMATLIVHYIQIHSQGHFREQNWKKKGKKRRRFGFIETIGRGRNPLTVCLSLGLWCRLCVYGPADRPWSLKVPDCSSE